MPSEQHLDRLTSIDASFLAQEKGGSHMHIGAAMVFEGPAPSHGQFTEHIFGRLHQVPRYRQKVAFPPLQLGRPYWIDDPTFQIEHHVHFTTLPKPGGVEELQRLSGRILSRRLDRSRPLWEIWLVDGLEGGRFAVFNKTHHSLVDGLSGVDLVKLLFDIEREPDEAGPAPDWTPARQVSEAELAARALRDWATAPIGLAREAAGAARKPFETAQKLQQIGEGTGEMLMNLASSAPESPLNCEIGPNRRVIWIDAELDDAKKVKNELGGTVNDVFLAVISGALNRWLRARGVATDGLQVRGAVPVSVLASDERDELGNNITLMVAHLPTDVEDPVERLSVVRDQMQRLKRSKQAVSAQAIGRLENLAPPNLFSGLHFSTRLYNLLVSNTPGPQFPLYLMGREMEEMIPIAFLAPNQALGVAFFSYNGTVSISLIGDHDAMPDLDGLAEAVKASIAELLEAARDPAAVTEPQATL